MARNNDKALPLARKALIQALKIQTPVDAAGYSDSAENNLIATVGPGVWRHVKGDLAAGKGSELDHKFCAAYSSSALAVNTFAPLLDQVDLGNGFDFRGDIRFEQERSAWAPGYWPTLDAVVEGLDRTSRLYVESKCAEFLCEGHANFSEAFVKHAERHLSEISAETFRRLAVDPFAFDPVDGRQLAKHFLAAPPLSRGRGVTLQDHSLMHRMGAR